MSIHARYRSLLGVLPFIVAGCGGSGSDPGPVMTLHFTAAPATATEEATIAPPIVVEVRADGVLDATASDSITLALGSLPPGATLTGTTTVAAVAGVATFTDLVVGNGFGPGFTLEASAAGSPSATSDPFTVTQAPATQVVITSVVPVGLAPFQAFDVTVEVRTAGNVLQTSATDPVTLSLGGGGFDLYWHASGNTTRVVELLTPDTDTVVGTLPTSIVGEIMGALYDPAFQILRMSNINSALMIGDPATGDEVRYADADTLSDKMKGLVFDGSGVLHAGNPSSAVHYTVDLVSGLDANVGSYSLAGFTVVGINGLARHPANGTVFAVVRVTSGPRRLATLDLGTGVLTDVGSLGDNFSQITFDPAGRLFGVTGDGATVPETLFQIDMADASTRLTMTLGNGLDGEVVTFVPRRLGGTLTVDAVGGVAVFQNLHVDQPGSAYDLRATAPGLFSKGPGAEFDVTGAVTPTATVEFQTALGTVAENVAGGKAQVSLVLSAAQTHNMPVFITIDTTSTATTGGVTPDAVQPRAFQVTIPAGTTVLAFDVPIVDDADVEVDETLVLTIRSARLSAGIGTNASHVLTIQSDDL